MGQSISVKGWKKILQNTNQVSLMPLPALSPVRLGG
jgi:hypothetical protein